MQRFKKHSKAGKSEKTIENSTWNNVKHHLEEEMAVLREKGLQDRIHQFKVENEEEFGENVEEDEASDADSEDGSESYSTMTDEDAVEEAEIAQRKRERKKKKREKETGVGALLSREALESDDEDYQPSEGHREDCDGSSTDPGSIDSADERVRSDSSGDDSEEDDDLNEDTTDEEEELLRKSMKKKKSKKLKKMKKSSKVGRVESDEEVGDNHSVEEENTTKEDKENLLELIVEEKVKGDVDVESSSSPVVMPPDMPRPNELFNIYNDRFDFALSNDNEGENETKEDNNMNELLGLCTGPFVSMPENSQMSGNQGNEDIDVGNDDDTSNSSSNVSSKNSNNSEMEKVVSRKKTMLVYGKSTNAVRSSAIENNGLDSDDGDDDEAVKLNKKRQNKQKKAMLKEFFEEEAELSESDQEHGRVSADEEDGGSSDDNYETDSEFEDEALKKLSENQLKKQVESIHMKQLMDEDERDLLQLRETIIPDADLADAVGPRLRRFRWADAWRDLGGTDLASQGENAHADDDWLGLGSLDENTVGQNRSSLWQKQRVERERFLQQQQQQQQQQQPENDDNSMVLLFLYCHLSVIFCLFLLIASS